MKKIYLFILATAIAAGMPTVTQASSVTKTFIGTIINGARIGDIATGNFTYDDQFVIDGDEELNFPEHGLTISFSFDGQFFDESNDIDFPGLPGLGFGASEPSFLDYVLIQGFNGVDFTDSSLVALSTFDLISSSLSDFDFSVEIEAAYVPVPGAVWFLCTGLAGLVTLRRKNNS